MQDAGQAKSSGTVTWVGNVRKFERAPIVNKCQGLGMFGFSWIWIIRKAMIKA